MSDCRWTFFGCLNVEKFIALYLNLLRPADYEQREDVGKFSELVEKYLGENPVNNNTRKLITSRRFMMEKPFD